jgi:hypothetical protein
MNRILLAGLALAALSACTPAQDVKVNKAVVEGALFCAKATVLGPVVVAALDASGAPLIVTNRAASTVAAWCAAINAFPVAPPADPANAPRVAVPVAPGLAAR